jgi:hypothetical protein
MIQTKHKHMHSSLQDRDMVIMVAVILILIAIVLVCCKQSVPAALLIVFVVALLALTMDSPTRVVVQEPVAASPPLRLNKDKLLSNKQNMMGQPRDAFGVSRAYMGTPVGVYNNTRSNVVPKYEGGYCGDQVPVKDITITNVPVIQSEPREPPRKCSMESGYTQFAPPAMNDLNSNTYQDLYVLPTEISRPPGQSIAEVQAKTDIKCLKKEMGAFPKPDRLQGNDVFIGEDVPLQIELTRLEQQMASNSVISQPSGSTTLDAALDVSPTTRPNYNFVKSLPDYDKEMKKRIRNEGLYGIQGDINCQHLRRSAVADTGFVQPLEARQEHLRYLAYDMPNYRNQWQTARSNTVNSDTRYFK